MSGLRLDANFEQSGGCPLTREMTEGPYYIDADSIPVVDSWHCDAGGLWSATG